MSAIIPVIKRNYNHKQACQVIYKNDCIIFENPLHQRKVMALLDEDEEDIRVKDPF